MTAQPQTRSDTYGCSVQGAKDLPKGIFFLLTGFSSMFPTIRYTVNHNLKV